ncbi:MAG: tRNA (adenosine(37)-N6)-threonylcarbamoyltransferase complex ATPase subunit type 1 TsaE [Actinomycetota bacterium]|nr:tRNA (adenosine(37)-N6)-threonylcarbamoyltransferase complex ATPase subunit type 1 TsaE [Actinomycetota bacterium]
MESDVPNKADRWLELNAVGEEAMIEVGFAIGSAIDRPFLITLLGDLGAGKTTLAKGIIAAQGVDEVVTSPTFIIQREYDGNLPIRHLDLYRFSGARSLDLMDIDLFDTGVLRLVEWPNAVDFVIEADIEVSIESAMGDQARSIRISFGANVGESTYEKLIAIVNGGTR